MPKKSPSQATETTLKPEEMSPMREDRTVYAELLPSQSDAAQFDPDQEASFQDWADALGTERSGYILRAYRLPMDDKGRAISTGGNSVLLEAWPLDAVKYDDLMRILRDEYMLPGMHVMAVRLMVSKDGERGVKKNQVVYVQRALRASTDNNHGKESVSELLRVMQENSQAQMNQLREMMQASARAQPAQRDPFEMMTMMMTAMGPIITAIAGRPQHQGSSITELIGALSQLKELTGDSAPRESEGSSFAGIASAVAPLVKPALETLAAASQERAAIAMQQASRNPAPRMVNPAPVITVPPNAQPVTENPPMFLLGMRPQIIELCNMIDANPQLPPDEVAQMVVEGVPEAYDEQLGEAAHNPKLLTWLAQMDSRVNTHRAWFESFQVALQKQFTDELETPAPPAAQ